MQYTRLHLTMDYNSKVYQTLLSYITHLSLVNEFNVVNLTYSSIPAWTELGPAQPQLIYISNIPVPDIIIFDGCIIKQNNIQHGQLDIF